MNVVLICGRAEQGRFPGRNMFPLLGRPLMVYPILASTHSSEIVWTFLTTDDPAMASVADHYGVALIDRPPNLRLPGVTFAEVVEHGYREIVRRLGCDVESIVVLLANAPTVTSDLIDQGIRMLRERPTADAVISVSLHNEFSPRHAMHLDTSGMVRPLFQKLPGNTGDVYFPDALLWVLRTERFFTATGASFRGNDWLVDTEKQSICPLVHEGYGDVDHVWQVPSVEEWLRRKGFTENSTPYDAERRSKIRKEEKKNIPVGACAAARRVLVTTVPFGDPDRLPLDLLDNEGIEYVINPIGRRLTEKELAEIARDFGVLIAGTEPITDRVMAAAPHLRLISRVGIGLDNVDMVAARRRGIMVSYTPDAPSPAVAELVMGLIISLLRKIASADHGIRNGVWHRHMGVLLANMTVGIIGTGRIGKRVLKHLQGFHPKRILVNDIQPSPSFYELHGAEHVDKRRMYSEADIITLHVPMTQETRHMIARTEMEMMKPGTMLINTSRGGIIHEGDLYAALKEKIIAAAAIDVYEQEPYSGPLVNLENCLLTSHMGSCSRECRLEMERQATEEVVRYLRGEPLQLSVPESEYVASGPIQ